MSYETGFKVVAKINEVIKEKGFEGKLRAVLAETHRGFQLQVSIADVKTNEEFTKVGLGDLSDMNNSFGLDILPEIVDTAIQLFKMKSDKDALENLYTPMDVAVVDVVNSTAIKEVEAEFAKGSKTVTVTFRSVDEFKDFLLNGSTSHLDVMRDGIPYYMRSMYDFRMEYQEDGPSDVRVDYRKIHKKVVDTELGPPVDLGLNMVTED